MYAFVRVEDVEPTIHHSERILGHPMIWRKTGFGTQCKAGSRRAERILTVVATLSKTFTAACAASGDSCEVFCSAEPWNAV
ncbi:MAG: hypothetical protein MUE73_13960 [Planctomycetes bacterium]|jgi:transposase|nr:hypothetical protein [Planctomycetota bacterium]